ncbi:MAG: alpha-amylase family glycosyl hydrolase [Balneolaceae bacterium]
MKEDKSSPQPGVLSGEKSTSFCYYCPEANNVYCEIFDDFESSKSSAHQFEKDNNGYWHLTINQNLVEKWYAYRIDHDDELDEKNPFRDQLFADPYSKHVTVKNNYRQEAKSKIVRDDFDWEGDQHQFPEDPRDLIIYETHLKDLTAHPSSKATGDGFYNKFIDLNQEGGIAHLKKLGVNCVEFLPLQKFPPVEPPYGEKTDEGFLNSWNPYAENYWGYMTSFFFAPESSFASDHSEKYSGYTTASITEFKNLVKELHKHGITVLMDVVYNHTSLFDLNPCTHLCPHTYLRQNEKGEFLNRSGTGNEFRSEHKVGRQLILDSLTHWMNEYHIDGFRFDLAALLDKGTWNAIRDELQAIDPKVVLIAEPWGGYYSPAQFSEHEWASWNDRIRNSVKGSDPLHDRGFIFSEWQHETGRERLENIFTGTLKGKSGGLFETSEHSVNYLESHDGYTLGDFIRIGLNPELADQKIEDVDAHITLNDDEMALSKLAAISLFCSQGMTMIHAGQEFARSKIIADVGVDDPDVGKMDHNSYQKDNATNWIDFGTLSKNKALFSYYQGLIELRKHSPALRKASPEEIQFDHFDNPLLFSFAISGQSTHDMFDYYVVLNGNIDDSATVHLPSGSWELLVNNQIASSQSIDILSGDVKISPKSGSIFRKLRN